jgi:hypothetical protein
MANEPSEPNPNEGGWLKMKRSPEFDELVEKAPLAFALLAIIARRARFMPGISPVTGLEQGCCFLGDYRKYGMSMQQYRTAKKQLDKMGFAMFFPSSKGTIARLKDTRIFEIFNNQTNNHEKPSNPASHKDIWNRQESR